MDSLSPELSQQLQSLGLCTPSDLRSCRARVQRMCRDLPAFDSVWIDALVQLGRLSPYQAKVSMADGPGQLAVGPFVLVDRIGSDGRLETFTARQPGTPTLYEVTLLRAPVAEHAAIVSRLQSMYTRLRGVRTPQVVVPATVQSDHNHVVAVAPWVGGRTLAELLVRRGRFPVPVVTEMARQLTAGLGQLERAGVLHGDLRLRTVRLDLRGKLSLTQPGLLAALEPTVTIHVDIPADAYDGVAPELIDSHTVRSTASELYALGCLLWQLLAGRPPHPAGDPLVKLAAHQTSRVADIRQWTPDVPASLAELLLSLTHPDPRQRPRSFSDVATHLGKPPQQGSSTLKQFARAFQSAAPRITLPNDRPKPVGRTLVVSMLLLCVGVVGGWMHGGLRSELLRVTQPLRAAVKAPDPTGVAASRVENTATSPPDQVAEETATFVASLLALPEPQQGVVRLTSVGPYRASNLSTVGNLSIVGTGEATPTIIVTDHPLRATGVAVFLQNVAIIRAEGATTPTTLLEVTAEDFGLVDCLVDGGTVRPATNASPDEEPALIHWSPLQRTTAIGGRIGWVNCVMTGAGPALACAQPPSSVQCKNVLHAATGHLLTLPEVSSARPLPIVLKHVTLRDCGGLVSMSAAPGKRPATLNLSAEHCLFDLAPGRSLITLHGVASPAVLKEAVLTCRLTGVESFLQTGAALATQSIPGIGSQPVDASAMPIEGLQYSTIQFSGPLAAGWRSSVPDRNWVKLAGTHAPGCDLTTFAQFPSAPYNSPETDRTRTVEAETTAPLR